MQRRTFIKQSCLACFSLSAVGVLFDACTSKRYYSAAIEDGELVIPKTAFEQHKENQIVYRSYVIAEHPDLQFPICVYRQDEQHYVALLMRCPHQGAELQVFGDKLQCPAHGSEFNRKGEVLSAPASENLRTFKVRTNSTQLKISLT